MYVSTNKLMGQRVAMCYADADILQVDCNTFAAVTCVPAKETLIKY